MLPASLRSKIVRWFISNGIAMFIAADCLFVTWFIALPSMATRGYNLNIFSVASAMGQSLETYPFIFIPIVIWHSADVLEGYQQPSTVPRSVYSYEIFLSVLSALGVSLIMLNTRYFFRLCDNRNMYSFACVEAPLPWIRWLCILLWIALMIIAVGKIVPVVAAKWKTGE
jgi:hypothetical protein